MENRQQQILSEIKDMMASIRVQLEQLDAKMAELQYEVDPQPVMMEPIDIGLDDLPVVDIVVEEPVSAPVSEPVCEIPTVHEVAQNVAVEKPAVIDTMTARQAWRTDMPGAPVRDIRSAISLNDRVLFINGLFDEDPAAFQNDLTALNQMASLDEAVAFLAEKHPSWKFDSEIVYRFMMALRRKVN